MHKNKQLYKKYTKMSSELVEESKLNQQPSVEEEENYDYDEEEVHQEEHEEPEMDEEEFLEVLKSNPMFSREAITQLLATQKIPVSARVKENTKRMTKVARKAANNSPNTRRSWSTLRPREHE